MNVPHPPSKSCQKRKRHQKSAEQRPRDCGSCSSSEEFVIRFTPVTPVVDTKANKVQESEAVEAMECLMSPRLHILEKGDASSSSTLKLKNRQIETLVDDNERLLDENKSLSNTLVHLEKSLSKRSTQVDAISSENLSLKSMLDSVEKEKRDLAGRKERQDVYLEKLSEAVEDRMEAFKKVMSGKEMEIVDLRNKVMELTSQISSTQQIDPDPDPEEDEEADEEESLESTIKKLQSQLEKRTKKVQALEAEAEEREAELALLTARLTQADQGAYALPHAVSDIVCELKLQLRIRDRTVEGAAKDMREVQDQVEDLAEENSILREKMEAICSQLKEDLNRLRDKEQEYRNSLTEAEGKVRQLSQQICAAGEKESAMEAEVSKWKSEAEEQFSFCSIVQNTVEQLQSEVTHLKDELLTKLSPRKSQTNNACVSTSTSTSQLTSPSPNEFIATPVLDQYLNQLQLIPVVISAPGSQLQLLATASPTLSSQSMPPTVKSSASIFDIWTKPSGDPSPVKDSVLLELESIKTENASLTEALSLFKGEVASLKRSLKAKDEAIKELEEDKQVQDGSATAMLSTQGTILASFDERLKAKDDEVDMIRGLLADARADAVRVAECHIDEITALQDTIHKQLQDLAQARLGRNKPVIRHVGVGGSLSTTDIIKTQLSRIEALEGELKTSESEAFSDAEKWKKEAEAKSNEVGLLNASLDEISGQYKRLIEGLKDALGVTSESTSLTELTEAIGARLKRPPPVAESRRPPPPPPTPSTSRGISGRSGGHSIQQQLTKSLELNLSLEKELDSIRKEKKDGVVNKIRSAENLARFEESQRWIRANQRLDTRVKELETQVEGYRRQETAHRERISRLERGSRVLGQRSSTTTGLPQRQSSSAHLLAQGEIARLNMEIQDLKELVDKTEFEGKEVEERLKAEIEQLQQDKSSEEKNKEIERLEEDNFNLKVQLEQIKMEMPKLQVKIQELQGMVTAFKARKEEEKETGGDSSELFPHDDDPVASSSSLSMPHVDTGRPSDDDELTRLRHIHGSLSDLEKDWVTFFQRNGLI